MKKTVITSTLALGLGVTGVASGQADASEQGIDKAQLAHTAQNNPQQLNDAPIHEGAYNYDFNHDKVDYNFDSDGTYWSWSYNGYGQGTADTNAQSTQDTEQSAPAEQATSTEQSEQAEQPQQTAAPPRVHTQTPPHAPTLTLTHTHRHTHTPHVHTRGTRRGQRGRAMQGPAHV